MTVLYRGLAYGHSSRLARVPELATLQSAKLGIYGVGAIGSFMAIEFARIGVQLLRLVDFDTTDPAGACRWPLGVSVAGLPKVHALKEFISSNYPMTEVDPVVKRLGFVDLDPISELRKRDSNEWDQMLEWNRELDLVIDATAEFGVQQCLAYQLSDLNIPMISVAAKPGGWGGEVVRGCALCYGFALRDKLVPEPPAPPNPQEVQPAGCADRTFAAAGFDTVEIAMMGVRFAVGTLCRGIQGAYPDYDGDAMTIHIRNAFGELIGPSVELHKIAVHPSCPLSHGTNLSH